MPKHRKLTTGNSSFLLLRSTLDSYLHSHRTDVVIKALSSRKVRYAIVVRDKVERPGHPNGHHVRVTVEIQNLSVSGKNQ